MTHKIQIDDVVRDATAQEAAAIDAVQSAAVTESQNLVEIAAARQSALAKLANIGLTAEEIKALVG